MNLLLSYPRSGNTWFRYCVEFLTKKPTIGYIRSDAAGFDREPIGSFVDIGVNRSQDNILVKRHATEEVGNFMGEVDGPIEKLILIVRDYKEVVIRHRKLSPTLDLLKDSCHTVAPSQNYIQMIEYFDNFEGEKLMVYYEDLINKLEPTLKSVLDFLGEDDLNLKGFISDIDTHRQQSIGVYGGSETNGKTAKFHSNRLNPEQKKSWDEHLKDVCPDLFNKYLIRYEEQE
jgi:hypothetical protein